LDQRHEALSLVRRKVIVWTLRNGRGQLVYRGKQLKWRRLPAGSERKKAVPVKQAQAAAQAPLKKAVKQPAATHPWRRAGVGAGGKFGQRIKAQGRAVRLALRDSGRPPLRSGLPASRRASRGNPTARNKQPGDILS
jgi:hypothetical protein